MVNQESKRKHQEKTYKALRKAKKSIKETKNTFTTTVQYSNLWYATLPLISNNFCKLEKQCLNYYNYLFIFQKEIQINLQKYLSIFINVL